MFQVAKNLFISDLSTLSSSSSVLEDNKITDIISIGCIYNSSDMGLSIRTIAYPNIEDTPETALLHLLPDVCVFFPPEQVLVGNRKVVVHCVYGQSRSASLVILYLMLIGNSLVESIAILTKAKPSN